MFRVASTMNRALTRHRTEPFPSVRIPKLANNELVTLRWIESLWMKANDVDRATIARDRYCVERLLSTIDVESSVNSASLLVLQRIMTTSSKLCVEHGAMRRALDVLESSMTTNWDMEVSERALECVVHLISDDTTVGMVADSRDVTMIMNATRRAARMTSLTILKLTLRAMVEMVLHPRACEVDYRMFVTIIMHDVWTPRVLDAEVITLITRLLSCTIQCAEDVVDFFTLGKGLTLLHKAANSVACHAIDAVDLACALSEASAKTTSCNITIDCIDALEKAMLTYVHHNDGVEWMNSILHITSLFDHLLSVESQFITIYIDTCSGTLRLMRERGYSEHIVMDMLRHMSTICSSLDQCSPRLTSRCLDMILELLDIVDGENLERAFPTALRRTMFVARTLHCAVCVMMATSGIDMRLFVRTLRIWRERTVTDTQIHALSTVLDAVDDVLTDTLRTRIGKTSNWTLNIVGVDDPLLHTLDVVLGSTPVPESSLRTAVIEYLQSARERYSSPMVKRYIHDHCVAYGIETDERFDEPCSSNSVTCPISLDVFRCPVVASDGYSYELASLLRYAWTAPSFSSPMTREPLSSTVTYNRTLVDAITSGRKKPSRRRQRRHA